MVMSALSDAPDNELAHSALVQAVGSSSSRVSHAVDALCGRGWLQRRRCEQTGACTTPSSPTKERGRWR